MDQHLQPLWFEGAKGVRLYAEAGGDPTARPVLLLHGGGQTLHSWKRGAKRLIEAGYYAIALDARGHGQSGWAADGDYSFPTRAADLQAVAAQFAMPPAVVGASMGGLSAIYAAGAGVPPLHVPALVLVDVTPKVDLRGARRVIDFMLASPDGFESLEAAAEAVAAYNPARPRPGNVAGLARNLRQRDGRWFWHWDPAFLRRDVDPAEHEASLVSAASKITAPVLLVRGGQSDVVGQAEIEHFRAVMRNTEYAEVSGAGHMVAGDKNDVFNDAIVDFLRRHAPP
jgi:pimeloyl-ACP methyl ester carboxylesterase